MANDVSIPEPHAVSLMLSISRRRNAMIDTALEANGGQQYVNDFFADHKVEAMKLWGKGIVREVEKPAGESIEDVLDKIAARKALTVAAEIVSSGNARAVEAEFSEIVPVREAAPPRPARAPIVVGIDDDDDAA